MNDENAKIGVFLPAVERFDGTGGAVATWVKHVYALPGLRDRAVIVSPRCSREYADGITTASSRAYDFFERIVDLAARAAAKVTGKTALGAYRILMRRDRLWKATALRLLKDVDVLHIHNRPEYVFSAREAGFAKPIVLHMHNDLSDYVTPEQGVRLATDCDTVVFCSDYAREKALEDFPALGRTAVVPNGVDKSEIVERVNDAPGSSLSLLFVGRLIPEKGAREAVEICEALNIRGIDTSLRIAGGTAPGMSTDATPYSRSLTLRAEEVNVSLSRAAVEVVGPIPHREVMRLMAQSDALILPCLWEEPFGMVALEAMAKGAVPFVTKRGGLPEVVQGGGVVIDVENDSIVSEFTQQIEAVLSESGLDALRNIGYHRAADLTWPRVAEEFEAVLSTMNP